MIFGEPELFIIYFLSDWSSDQAVFPSKLFNLINVENVDLIFSSDDGKSSKPTIFLYRCKITDDFIYFLV